MKKRRIVVLVVAVMALVAAACGGGDKEDSAKSGLAAKESATTTTAGPGASSAATPTTTSKGGKTSSAGGSIAAGAGSSTTAPGSSGSPSAGTSSTGSSSGPAATSAGASNVPPAGRYTYRVTGTTTTGTGPTATTKPVDGIETDEVTVTPVAGGHDVKVVTEAGDEHRESLYRVTDASTVLVELKSQGPSGTLVLRPNPPMTVALFPLTVGKTWNIQWRDDATTVQGTGTGKVARTERIGRVDTTVVEIRQQISGPAAGRFDVDAWVDLATGRQLRQHIVTDIQFGANRNASDVTRELT